VRRLLVARDNGRAWIEGPADSVETASEALGPGWAPADRWQLLRFRLTRARFSWIDLVAISVIATILRQLVGWR
jgi:hypothetical protein